MRRLDITGYPQKVYKALRLLYSEPQTPRQLADLLGVECNTLTKTLAELHRHGVLCVVSYRNCGGYQARTYTFGSESIAGATVPSFRPTVADICMRIMLTNLMNAEGCTYDDLVEVTGLAKSTVLANVAAMRVAGIVYVKKPAYTTGCREYHFHFGIDKRDVRMGTRLTGAQRQDRHREKKRLHAETQLLQLRATPPSTAAVQLALTQQPHEVSRNAESSS